MKKTNTVYIKLTLWKKSVADSLIGSKRPMKVPKTKIVGLSKGIIVKIKTL